MSLKNNTCIKCVFKEERGMRVNLLESIKIIAHESQGTIHCSKIQTNKWEKLEKCVVIQVKVSIKQKCLFKEEIGIRLNCKQSLYLQLLWHSKKCFRHIIEKN